MASKDRPPAEGHIEQQRRIMELEANIKFRFFFVALIFTILSFSLQYPVKTSCIFVKIFEIISWFLLFLSGYFSLVKASGIELSIFKWFFNKINFYEFSDDIWMWLLFYSAIFLMLLVKISDSFYGF